MHGMVPLPGAASIFRRYKGAIKPFWQPLSHLCWGRAETGSPNCAQHIIFYPVCQCDNMFSLGLHWVSHCQQTGMLSARSFRAIEHHQTCYDYPEVLGFVGVQMGWDIEPEPWPRRGESSWAVLLEAIGSRFTSGGSLQELIWKVKIAHFSQNQNTKVDISFESAESLCFSNWDI